MSYIPTFEEFLNENNNHLNENEIEKLKFHLKKLKQYHPSDDSPYADIYGGYTVGDSRRAIRDKLDRLGAIKHRDPSPSAIAKRRESVKKRMLKARDLKKKIKADPKFKIASEIKQMQYTINTMPGAVKSRAKQSMQPKIDKLLTKGGFTSIANAVNYYNDNKPKVNESVEYEYLNESDKFTSDELNKLKKLSDFEDYLKKSDTIELEDPNGEGGVVYVYKDDGKYYVDYYEDEDAEDLKTQEEFDKFEDLMKYLK